MICYQLTYLWLSMVKDTYKEAAMKKNVLSILFTTVLVLGIVLGIALPVGATSPTVITGATIVITQPVIGGTPQTTIASGTGYAGTITWTSPATGNFVAGTPAATVILTAAAGYTFTGINPTGAVTISGANTVTYVVTTVTNAGDTLTINVSYTALSPNITAVTLSITAPVIGGTPQATITPETGGNYAGTIIWTSPSSGPFVAGTPAATVVLTANTNYTFTSIPATGAVTIAGATSATYVVSGTGGVILTITVGYAALVPTAIATATIVITPPAIGGTPQATIASGTGYTGNITWTSPSSGSFVAGTPSPAATVVLTAGPTYTFTGIAATGAVTIAGSTSATYVVSGSTGGTLTITVGYAALVPTAIASATIVITAPAIGGTPQATIASGTGYSGTINWTSPSSGPFVAGTPAATVVLTAGPTYTFTGIAATGAVTISGSTSATYAVSGATGGTLTITVGYAALSPNITGATIVITTPVIGGTPQTTIAAGAGYTGTITWTSPTTGNFVAGTPSPAATVILTANSGCTFTGITPTGAVTIAGSSFATYVVTTSTNPGDTLKINVGYAALVPTTVSSPITITITTPVIGATAQTSVGNGTGYTGTSITWTSSVTGGKFVVGTPAATIVLTAATGYTFTGIVAHEAVRIAGSASGGCPSYYYTDGTTLTISVTWAALTQIVITTVPIYIYTPYAGDTPQTSIEETDYYTGTINWTSPSGGGNFVVGTPAPAATVVLTANTGYTFTGIAATGAVYIEGSTSVTYVVSTVTTAGDTLTITVGYAPLYDKTLYLNENGWTLVSTDNYIFTSGPQSSSFSGSVSMILKYTSTGWLTATVADLNPVTALYVKTTGSDGQLGLNYSGVQPGPSTVNLVAGWNLISTASYGCANDILSSLRYVQVGTQQQIGLATLVNQGSINYDDGYNYSFYVDATNWRNLSGYEYYLSPFEGYWVYMNAPATFGVIPAVTTTNID
jgi:hypothetical protein